MKRFLLILSLLSACISTPNHAQMPEAQPLYPEGAPDSNGLSPSEAQYTDEVAFNTTEADYLLFAADPQNATGQAVVVCPGGGYGAVCFDHEGIQVARWLNEQGITAAILRYRMPNGHPEVPIGDALTLIRTLREKSDIYGIDPHRIGIMGFSAGGHLAAAASTLFTDSTDRPDFSVLIYAAITDDQDIIDRETFGNLLKSDLSDTLTTRRYSCEKQVTDQTPPAFLACSDDDDNVWPENSTRYYSALKRHGIAAELHVFPTGRHGWGWNPDFKYSEELRTALARWLKTTGENQ